MKKIFNLRSTLFLAALALASSVVQTEAQFPINASYVNNFDVGDNTEPFSGSGSVASWIYWYSVPGGNTPMTNDVTTPDPNGGASAGSLEVYSPFSAENGYGATNHTQNLFFGTFGNGSGYDFSVLANLLNFDYVSFDIYVGTNQVSAPDANGGWGTLGVGIINNTTYGYEQFGNGSVEIPGSASNGWVHMQVPIDYTVAGITTAPGICFDYNSYGGYPTNDFTFWIGNLTVHYSGAPPPPPTGSLSKTIPGLAQFADAAPTYNRQSIRTDQTGAANLSWYGSATPVTYAWTIASYPTAAYPNYITALTITPDPVDAQTYPDPDWSASNVVWIAFQNNADGTTTAGIAWKTNQPAGNGQLFSTPGQLIPFNVETNGLTVPSAVGTWSVTFDQNTNITLTGPNGSSTNAVLPPEVAALYNGYVGVYLYSSENGSTANIGQYVTMSAYKVTNASGNNSYGAFTPVNEDLTSGGPLSSPFLVFNSQGYANNTNPPNQVFVTTNDIYWFSWTLPDVGFSPVSTSSLNMPVWNDIGGTPFQNGGMNFLKLTKAQLPSSETGFFALLQRTFTQLQILLPGQTNAPDTTLGYVGTPDPQSLSAVTDVTVNAVDSTFHIISGVTDQIQLTSSDTSAYLPDPVAMVNGTASFSEGSGLLFGSEGTWTVTAMDTTSTTITNSVTSAPVTVGP
jgi:hypothetical protein